MNFTDNSSGNITSWNWSFPGGTPSSSAEQNPTVTYPSTGLFDVTLTVSNGNDTQTLTQENYIAVITEPETPEIPSGEEHPWSMPYCEFEYTIPAVLNAASYEWVAEPADAIETLINQGTICTIDFVDWYMGNVELKVKAVNDCGESSFSDELTLFVWWESVSENQLPALKILPNPSTGVLNVKLGNFSDDIIEVKVYNSLGSILYSATKTCDNSNPSFTLDFGEIEPGIYYIVISGEQLNLSDKIIIR